MLHHLKSLKKKIRAKQKLDVSNVSFGNGPSRRQLILRESEIGGRLCGPVPEGVTRRFFNLDTTTWILVDETATADGHIESSVTRYEVHERGVVLRVQDDVHYGYISTDELMEFTNLTRAYYDRVMRDVYHSDPRTGEPLVA